MKIPITKPYFGPEEAEAIQKPLESGWVVQGPYVKQFEEAFAAYVQAPHAIATTSCTTALHIAVAMLGLKPGDEVLVPAFTWISTANVVEYMGATPVFCDIDLATFNLDPNTIEDAITEKTVGIIPVHLFGLCADMEAILSIAKKHGLWVVEDAACGLGGTIHEKHAGTFGDAGCFSFLPRKSITTGEGGMIVTNDDQLHDEAHILREHGASRTDLARHDGNAGFLLSEYKHLGYNYRMTDLQGALGTVQMTRVDWILEQRRRIANRYTEAFANHEWLWLPQCPEGFTHGYQAYVTLFSPEPPTMDNVDRLHQQRNETMQRLESSGIATRQGTHAAAHLEYYRDKYSIQPSDFPNAWIADRLSLAFPLYPHMTEEELSYVCEHVNR